MKKQIFGLIGMCLLLGSTCLSYPTEVVKIEKGKTVLDVQHAPVDFNFSSAITLVVANYNYDFVDLPGVDFSPALCSNIVEPIKQHEPDTPYLRYWDKNFAYNNYVKPRSIESLLIYSMAYSC